MENLFLNEKFLIRRKKEFTNILKKAKEVDLNNKFRDKSYKKLINILLKKSFLAVNLTDAIKAKETGVLPIKNNLNKQIGALYLREYNDEMISSETNNYAIEAMILNNQVSIKNKVIKLINEIFGEADMIVAPESNDEVNVLIWTSGSEYYDDLIERIKEEYGKNTICKLSTDKNKKVKIKNKGN